MRLYTVARQAPASMDRCQKGDLRTLVEISICTGVGPDWRRLHGTTRSDWSTAGTSGWVRSLWVAGVVGDMGCAPYHVRNDAVRRKRALTSRSSRTDYHLHNRKGACGTPP